MNKETIKVPDLGGAESVEVIEICVVVGDRISEDDSLIVMESEKASMELPSPFAGVVTAITIGEGDTLSEGDTVLELEVSALENEGGGGDNTESPRDSAIEKTKESPPLAVEKKESVSAKPAATKSAAIVEMINIPDIGDVDNVEVIEVCVTVGDEISEGDSLIVLETDKASMEIPSPHGGKIISIAVREADTVIQGSPILELEYSPTNSSVLSDITDTSPVKETAPEAQKIPSPPPVQKQSVGAQAIAASSRIYAGPAVRLLAREMGVDLQHVKGTGPRDRIGKDDLKNFVKTSLAEKNTRSGGAGIPAIPAVDFSKFGEISFEALTKIGKLTAKNMQRNWLNIPHVTQFDEADISDLEDFRKSLKAEAEGRGVKITPLPFLLKACAMALRENPKFNTSLHEDGEQLVYKHYIHIGMAVDTPAGLVVPVIRDVDKKSIWELAEESAELAEKAKTRKLLPAQMQGACFTISSLGNIGGQGFTPIVNAPEVAILGVSKMQIKPVWNGSEFVPRKMLPLSVSYDHRAINGVDGGKFFTYLATLLSDIRRLVL